MELTNSFPPVTIVTVQKPKVNVFLIGSHLYNHCFTTDRLPNHG